MRTLRGSKVLRLKHVISFDALSVAIAVAVAVLPTHSVSRAKSSMYVRFKPVLATRADRAFTGLAT